jgi:hypothetical protein
MEHTARTSRLKADPTMTVETQIDTLPRIVTGDGMMLAGPEELKGFWTEE